MVDDKASVNVGQSYPLTWSDSFAVSFAIQLFTANTLCVSVQLRAAIGDAASRYHTAVDEDPHFRVS